MVTWEYHVFLLGICGPHHSLPSLHRRCSHWAESCFLHVPLNTGTSRQSSQGGPCIRKHLPAAPWSCGQWQRECVSVCSPVCGSLPSVSAEDTGTEVDVTAKETFHFCLFLALQLQERHEDPGKENAGGLLPREMQRYFLCPGSVHRIKSHS